MSVKSRKKFKKYIILLALAFLLLGYCTLEPHWVRIKEISITSSDIPASFDNKKIIFISDIHHGPYFSVDRVKMIVQRINELRPDIVVMGGDYCHRERKYIKPVFDELRKFNSEMGIYAVLGNHDHWEDAELTRQMMSRNGINICDNRSYWVKSGKDRIKIGGVGDLWEDIQITDSTTKDVREKDFCILVSHNPDYLEDMNSNLVDLTLSGHTHGGQITLFGLWAPKVPSKYGQKYRYGLKEFGKMKSYITSGIGTITPPVRFFCRPEIVVITLKTQ
ncbi:MAG TPA: metallophosphoesterase [Bacteroidales bacterium]|nr:metallophosphoesterase [Bacteroidales bacterium]